jgi:hypothetical protein
MIRKISSILVVCSLAISAVAENFPGTATAKTPQGTYVVESFDYKDATNPSKDYMLSRGDFNEMVRFHSTFEFKKDGSIVQLIGEWKQEYVGEMNNSTIRMYPCGNMNAKDLCIKLSKQNNDFSEYKVEESGDKLTLSKSNQVFILKLHLKKVK